MNKFLIKRLLFILPGLAAYLVTKYAQYHPDWTEQAYSRSVYPAVSAIAGFLPSQVSFSVTEWLVVFLLLFCLGYIICYICKIKNSKDKDRRKMIAYRGFAGAAAICSMVYFVYTVSCGLNYHRYTFTHYTGYETAPAGVEELEQLCLALAGKMEQVREQLGEDKDLSVSEPGAFDYYSQHSIQVMEKLGEEYPVLNRSMYSAPKPVLMSGVMSGVGIAGVFVPFTMESNINVDLPFFALPATMVHELAHQCGFMREDEANYIAYLACRQSDQPLMLYSGLFSAFYHSIDALEEADAELAAKIRSDLSPAVQYDIEQHEQFWDRHDSIISDISRTVIDINLKLNNQNDGVASYNRMVELLLAEQRAEQEKESK